MFPFFMILLSLASWATIHFVSLTAWLALQADPAGGNADIGPILALVGARALALTPIVKVAVDVVMKMMAGASGKILPLVAMGLAFCIDLLLNIIGGVPFTLKSVALALLTGVLAGAGAVVVTEVHNAVTPPQTSV